MGALDGFERTVTQSVAADSNLIQLVDERLSEQGKRNDEILARLNDVFRLKLIEVLDRHDGVRAEIMRRLDQIAASACNQQLPEPIAEEQDIPALESSHACENAPRATRYCYEALLVPGEAEQIGNAAVVGCPESVAAKAETMRIEMGDGRPVADQRLIWPQQEIEAVVTEIQQLVSRAEEASRDALETCASSNRTLEEALGALKLAREEATKAANCYSEADHHRIVAVESYERARQDLATAEEAMKTTTAQLTDARNPMEGVLDSIRNAENEANKAITLAMGAGAKAQVAEEELRKSQHLMRRTRSWALATLFASLSIGAWETVRAATTLHYMSGAPVVVTAIATVIGVIAWRSDRSD